MADVDAEFAKQDYLRLPISKPHFATVAEMPRHHGDPFDHLLIAQAKCENLAILTADEKFGRYPVRLA
jgi:PIN domain nuclease of toxin-antitoxin system